MKNRKNSANALGLVARRTTTVQRFGRAPRASETSTAAAALAAAAVSFPRRSRRAKPERYAGGFPRSSTALMRRTPAEEDSSFLILKCPRTPVCSTCGPVQTSLEKKSSRVLPIV